MKKFTIAEDFPKSEVVKSPYISGETLRSLDDPEDFIVISVWETSDDWQKWFHSKERKDLQGRVDSLIGEKNFYEVFEAVSH